MLHLDIHICVTFKPGREYDLIFASNFISLTLDTEKKDGIAHNKYTMRYQLWSDVHSFETEINEHEINEIEKYKSATATIKLKIIKKNTSTPLCLQTNQNSRTFIVLYQN